jgi:hypothetical protein
MNGILTHGFVVAAPRVFAINGDDLALGDPEHACDPPPKASRERLRFEQTEHSPKGIMRRYPIRQVPEAAQPADFGVPIRLDFTPRVRPTNYGTDGNYDAVHQPMLDPALDPWIAQSPIVPFDTLHPFFPHGPFPSVRLFSSFLFFAAITLLNRLTLLTGKRKDL